MTAVQPTGEARVRIRTLVGWGLTGQLSYVASQFLLLFALVHFSTVEDVGRFGLATAIILPINALFGLQLRYNQATDVARQFNFNEFLYVRTVAGLIAYVVVLAVSFLFLDPAARMITIVFGAAKGIENFSDLFYGGFQRADRNDRVARSLILRGVGGSILFTAILATTHIVELAFLGLLVSWATVAFFVDYRLARQLARADGDIEPVRKSNLIALVRSSVPLTINALLAALQSSTPRYIISWTLGIAALGHFAVVAYAMQATTTVVQAINQSIVARLAFFASVGNRRAFFKVIYRFIAGIASLSLVGVVASLVVGDWIIEAVFGSDYANQGYLLAICILNVGLRSGVVFFQGGIIAFRRFDLGAKLRFFSTALMFVTCFIGAKLDGLTGVAWGMAVVFLVHAIALCIMLQRMPFSENASAEKS